uniref:Uncharacterized protein n=1 Tax=Rhizophora mucronata TaxID=61149 RepID=A0A2P2MHT1_RHIMU
MNTRRVLLQIGMHGIKGYLINRKFILWH